jgi:hypothetical protein
MPYAATNASTRCLTAKAAALTLWTPYTSTSWYKDAFSLDMITLGHTISTHPHDTLSRFNIQDTMLDCKYMAKNRGKEHTTLTETAQEVVSALKGLTGVKMVAPGIINTNGRKSGGRFVTIVHTSGGFELIISGQSVQKVAVHAEKANVKAIIESLKANKRLKNFDFKERERKPGV